jgi:hypothetical protein
MTPLTGKYFLGVHDDAMRSGVIEAALRDAFYLVRFDKPVGFTDGSKWPGALAVVYLGDMVRGNGSKPWLFFDNEDQRAQYEAWQNEAWQTLPPHHLRH